MGSKRTKSQLRDVTDYRGFESFCHDLMALCGYEKIVPLGGFRDKGRDAVHVSQAGNYITIFAYSVREDWKTKLAEDLRKVRYHGHDCDQLVFITTEDVSAGDIDHWQAEVKHEFGWKLEIYALERIATLVDTLYAELKRLHPNIFYLDATSLDILDQPSQDTSPKPIDLHRYAEHILNAFAEWQERYTPLLAEYREFELYVVSTSPFDTQRVPVLQVSHLAPAVVLLGESGAGKTTALWRMAVDLSNQLIQSGSGHLPVLVGLRNWSPDCPARQLIQNQFAAIGVSYDTIEDELINGNCLLLIDGLNELPHRFDHRDAARRDLQNLLDAYPGNQYVFTCRTLHYDPQFLTQKPDQPLPCFEIQRLDRQRVEEYVRRYFKNNVSSADDLLAQLELSSDHKWGEQASFVHLARIPLHLQMIIAEYECSGQIPPNKAEMLRTFVSHMVARDRVRQAARVGVYAKERVLGRLAYKSIENDYYLSLPRSFAETILAETVQILRSQGVVPTHISAASVWDEILSNNFLAAAHNDPSRRISGSTPALEWLHQLVFDYFLACETIRILVVPGTEEASQLRGMLFAGIWDQPCQIALGLLDAKQGARLLGILVRVHQRLAQHSFQGQSEEDAAILADAVIKRFTEGSGWDEEMLEKISLALPYVPIVNGLIHCFRTSEEYKRGWIAKIVSRIARECHGSAGGKRAEDILESWIANRNEIVRFHSATGLWERDPGHAAFVLRGLYNSGSPWVQDMVRDLVDEWGLY